jgi:Protein of unknown function (DUF1573)
MRSATLLLATAPMALGGGCVHKSHKGAPHDGGALFQVSEATRDFGTVTEGDKLEQTFVLKNTSGVPIELARVDTNAPWVTAKAEPMHIGPGDKTRIEVSLDTLGHTGDVEKRVMIVSKAPPGPVTKLYVRAHVRPLLAAEESDEEEDEEFLHIGDKSSRDVWFTGARVARAHFTIERITSPDVSAELIKRGQGGAVRQGLHITVNASELGSYHAGVFLSTGIKSRPELKHYFEWTVLGNVSVVPPSLHFVTGAALSAPGGNERVAVLKSRDKGFKVRAVKSSSPTFSATVKPGASPGVYELHVHVADRKALARTEVTNVQVSTNDKFQPTISVAITASGPWKPLSALAASSRPQPHRNP